jgi:hypothetical protein
MADISLQNADEIGMRIRVIALLQRHCAALQHSGLMLGLRMTRAHRMRDD